MDRARRRELEDDIYWRVKGRGPNKGLRVLIKDSLGTVLPFLDILRDPDERDIVRKSEDRSYREACTIFLNILERKKELYIAFLDELWRRYNEEGSFERLFEALDPKQELRPPDNRSETGATARTQLPEIKSKSNTSSDETSRHDESDIDKKVVLNEVGKKSPCNRHNDDLGKRGEKEEEKKEEDNPDDEVQEMQSEKAANLADDGNVLNKGQEELNAPPRMSSNINSDSSKSHLSTKRMPTGRTAQNAAGLSGDENPWLGQPMDEVGGGGRLLLPNGSLMFADDFIQHSGACVARIENARAGTAGVSAESPRGERSEPPSDASGIYENWLLDDLQRMKNRKDTGLDVVSESVSKLGSHNGADIAAETRSISDLPPPFPSLTPTLTSTNQPSFLEDDSYSTPIKQTATPGPRHQSKNVCEVSDGSDRVKELRCPVATLPEDPSEKGEVCQPLNGSMGTLEASVELSNSVMNLQASSHWPSHIPHILNGLDTDSMILSSNLSSRGHFNVTDQAIGTYSSEQSTKVCSSQTSSFSIPSSYVLGTADVESVSSDGSSEVAVADNLCGRTGGSISGEMSSPVNPEDANTTEASSTASSRSCSSSVSSGDVVGTAHIASASSDGVREAAVARSLSAQAEGSIRREIAEPSSFTSVEATPRGRHGVTNHVRKKWKCISNSERDERATSEEGDGTLDEGDRDVDDICGDGQMEEGVEPGRNDGNVKDPFGFTGPQTMALSVVAFCVGVCVTYVIMRRG